MIYAICFLLLGISLYFYGCKLEKDGKINPNRTATNAGQKQKDNKIPRLELMESIDGKKVILVLHGTQTTAYYNSQVANIDKILNSRYYGENISYAMNLKKEVSEFRKRVGAIKAGIGTEQKYILSNEFRPLGDSGKDNPQEDNFDPHLELESITSENWTGLSEKQTDEKWDRIIELQEMINEK